MPTEFAKKVYKQLKKVPKGKITTYKEIAKSINSKAYQAVGTALKNNPYAPKVPCHRVISNNGSIGGFKGFKQGSTINEKIQMLKNEGIKFEKEKVKNLEDVLFRF
jgi:methylated-DNA-[protein]-cysteine S-methyltransferase